MIGNQRKGLDKLEKSLKITTDHENNVDLDMSLVEDDLDHDQILSSDF